jgi:hypothetical protein
MWEAIATFLLKFLLQEGILKVEAVFDAAEIERKAREKDAADKQQAVDDLRGSGNDPSKTVEQNEKEAEDAADRFHDRLTP